MVPFSNFSLQNTLSMDDNFSFTPCDIEKILMKLLIDCAGYHRGYLCILTEPSHRSSKCGSSRKPLLFARDNDSFYKHAIFEQCQPHFIQQPLSLLTAAEYK